MTRSGGGSAKCAMTCSSECAPELWVPGSAGASPPLPSVPSHSPPGAKLSPDGSVVVDVEVVELEVVDDEVVLVLELVVLVLVVEVVELVVEVEVEVVLVEFVFVVVVVVVRVVVVVLVEVVLVVTVWLTADAVPSMSQSWMPRLMSGAP